MFQGTGSDVGKSLLVAGLCRAFANRGLKVRPFKPQNMSNNAAVTADGGEIGRAQALQALAARVPLSVHMNPVLLKPQSDIGAQVVVQGRVAGTAKARDYYDWKPKLLESVLESFRINGEGADLVLVEGAGSPAEVNLRAADIANMGFAEAAQVPVILVGDIDRGGVIAQIVGTHAVISEADRAHLAGFVINKFRGDPTLFDDGMKIIAEKTGLKSFGLVPYFADARVLPKEDAMALDNRDRDTGDGDIVIAVPRLPRIANFDDLDPLTAEPGVRVEIIEMGDALPGNADVVLLAGSKATLADLKALRDAGWDTDIAAHHRRGGLVVGLCGGYQMMGRTLADPDGIEGPPETAEGLGLLDVDTVIGGDKSLVEVAGTEALTGAGVHGYEMHMGRTTGPDTERPWLTLDGGRPDGAISADGRAMAGYLHGIFASDDFRHAFLKRIRGGHSSDIDYAARVDAALDGLAAHLETHMDLDGLLALAR
ncbi:MAG: cobyric acid synthase [Rhodospirillales bacterium]|nr:cobyric acid synthase [Rhodospirillales bacterium]MBO6788440.1 cobyric acid synthase [Rhodospirillales bacterium]